jgi:hypothetical protein
MSINIRNKHLSCIASMLYEYRIMDLIFGKFSYAMVVFVERTCCLFLAHLRTMSSRWAFLLTHCPSSIVRPSKNFCKQLFLLILLAKFVKTYRDVPCMKLYQSCSRIKYHKELWLPWQPKYYFTKILKNLLKCIVKT